MLRFQLDTTRNLLKDLIAWWPLDEPGGQRRDMLGYNPLTDNATVTSAKGIGGQGTAASFASASSEYLSVADNPQISPGNNDFTFTAWVYFDTKPSFAAVFSKYHATAASREFLLRYRSAIDRFEWSARGATVETAVNADVLGSPTTGAWYFIACWHDATNDTINIQINNGLANSAAHSDGVADTTTQFNIGAYNAASDFFNGRVAYVGFWKRVLSQQERSDLYNFGKGNRLIAY